MSGKTELRRVFDPVVTDHAVIRWLERVHGMDIEAVRRAILAEGRGTWLAAGATAIHANQIGVTLVAEKGRVITVKPQSKRGVEP